MGIRIAAISDEPIYPSSFLPRTLFDILKVLESRGCKILLLQPGEGNSISEVESFKVITFSKTPNFFTSFFKTLRRKNEPMYKTAASWLNFNVYRTIWRKAKSVDVIMTYDIQYAIHALIAARITGKPLIMLGDIMYISYYRGTNSVSKVFLWLLLAWEKAAIRGVDRISVWGYDDRQFLVSSGISERKIQVVPLSIDIERIDLLSSMRNSEPIYQRIVELKERGFKIIMFHGNLDYAPNHSCVDYIVKDLAPELFKKHEKVAFVIVGASHEKHESIGDRIIFAGRVENIFSYITLADMGIVPLTFGAGVKNKILEYFALSKPVVTTAIGIENLRVVNMIDCLVTPISNFSSNVAFLLENPQKMALFGTNGRKYLEKYHALKNYEKFLDMGLELLPN